VVDLLDGLAQHLADRGIVTYVPDGTGGDLFVETLPDQPEVAAALALYGGPTPDSRLPYDEPSLQVRTRGGADPRVSRRLANAIYDELHGLGPVTLADGTYLLSCIASQTPTYMGRDELGRHEHVTNYALERHNPTAHRPA
jgi:dienelactone hydrolase